MISCTTLVNVDTDTSFKLVNFVGSFISSTEERKEFSSACNELINSSQPNIFIDNLLGKFDIILNCCENENGLNILCSKLKHLYKRFVFY